MLVLDCQLVAFSLYAELVGSDDPLEPGMLSSVCECVCVCVCVCVTSSVKMATARNQAGGGSMFH